MCTKSPTSLMSIDDVSKIINAIAKRDVSQGIISPTKIDRVLQLMAMAYSTTPNEDQLELSSQTQLKTHLHQLSMQYNNQLPLSKFNETLLEFGYCTPYPVSIDSNDPLTLTQPPTIQLVDNNGESIDDSTPNAVDYVPPNAIIHKKRIIVKTNRIATPANFL
ncbi:hypothetical protein SNEBB_002752 [Seison nebaliae]|nr:hypothetical protein SNEBB_002752 [Seison nebaliae]